MLSEVLKRRRLKLLKELARKARGRHDSKILLSEIAPVLDVKAYVGGIKFVDPENPVYEGGSDFIYDLNTLLEEGYIKQTYLDHERDSVGGVIYKNPAIMVTMEGIEAVVEADKSWFRKAIERQPMTFLQIIVTIIIAVASGIGGWIIGRYITPVEPQKSSIVQQVVPGNEPGSPTPRSEELKSERIGVKTGASKNSNNSLAPVQQNSAPRQ